MGAIFDPRTPWPIDLKVKEEKHKDLFLLLNLGLKIHSEKIDEVG